MKLTLEENKAINNKSVEAIEKANKMVQKQQKEIEELKMKLEAQTSNNLYRNLKEKSRNNLKEWTNQLESELDNYRQEYTRLHYEASTLKSQLEYNEIEHKRTVEGLKLQYESEITNLQNKIDDLLMEKHHENKQEGQQLHILQKENVQLQSKIKGLSTELEELQKVKEKVGLRTDNVVRLQTKQLTEHEINIRTLESEIKSCELQKEATEKELSLCYENNKILTSELQSTKKELILIKNQLEEVKQKCQIELANIKVENLRNKGKLERDKSQLNIELSNLKLDVETAKEELEQERINYVKREEELQNQIHILQFRMWEEKQKAEKEKKEQEELLRKSEISGNEAKEELRSMMEKLDRNNLEFNKAKIILENEIILLKTKLEDAKQELRSAEEVSNYVVALQKELSSLKQEKLDSKKKLNETQEQLQKQIKITNDLKHEIENLKLSSNKEKVEQSQLFIQQKMNIENERQNFGLRINELEKQLSEIHIKNNIEIQNLREKKQQYGNLIAKLRKKIQLLEAKVSELETENQVLQKNVSPEAHAALKKQFCQLRRERDALLAGREARRPTPAGDRSSPEG